VDSKPDPPTGPSAQQKQLWLKIAVGIAIVLALVWLNLWLAGVDSGDKKARDAGPPAAGASSGKGKQASRDDRPQQGSTSKSRKSAGKAATDPGDREVERDSLIVPDVRLTDENGDVVYRGDVDLRPTLDRIERGQRLRFAHDGIVFENRERRLPAKPAGYYHEFVQPTPNESGPGGQRLVIGREGEVYYSPDHYRTFERIR
jgi:filamentous hemagglutinin